MQKTFFLLFSVSIFFSLKTYCQNITLKINGANGLETKKIDSLNYLKLHKDYKSLQEEVNNLQEKLLKDGYLETYLNEIKKVSDTSYTAKIYIKRKYDFITVYYNKNTIPKTVLEIVSNKINDTYFEIPIKKIEESLNYINSKIAALGMPFSKVKLSNIRNEEPNKLKANLVVIKGNKKRFIDNVVIKGYEKFPKSYLNHFLKIKKKQIFNLKTINNKIERLNDLRFANQIKPPEVLFSKDSTSLYLYLEKSQSNSFDGFLGFGTNDKTNKLEFDGYLNLNLVNNLNFGETFKLIYKSDENDQNTFETNLTLPYILKSPIGLDLQLHIFRRDSSFSTTKQSIKVHYQINSKHKVYAGTSNIKSNNLLSPSTINQINDFNTNYYSLAYNFIKPQSNNLLFPVNTSFFMESNFGKRENNSSTEKQSLLYVDAFNIINFNTKNSIYVRVNASKLSSESYFENELLRFGGINSIRGFEENSILASQYGLINAEFRYQLNNSIFIHTITDAAYFENKLTNTNEKLFGYGFGLGILTKSGLLKLNYANGKNEKQKFKLSNSKIHISLKAHF